MKGKKKVITLVVVAALVLSLGTVGALAAANASRVNPENIKEVVSDDGTVKLRMYVNLDENGVPVDLTDEELQEVYDLLQPRDENGNIIPHVCDENCKYPVEIMDAPDGYTPLANRTEGIQPGV